MTFRGNAAGRQNECFVESTSRFVRRSAELARGDLLLSPDVITAKEGAARRVEG
jgi:hypothetical protein